MNDQPTPRSVEHTRPRMRVLEMAVVGSFFAAGILLGALAIFGGSTASGEPSSARGVGAGGTASSPGPALPSLVPGSPSVVPGAPSLIPDGVDEEATATAAEIATCLDDAGLDVSEPSNQGYYGGVGMTVDLGGEVVLVAVFSSDQAAADAGGIAGGEYPDGVIIPVGDVLLVYEVPPTVDTRMEIEGCALPLPS